jgi:hypothetical protein
MFRFALALLLLFSLSTEAAQKKKKGGKKFVINTFTKSKLTDKFWAEGAHYGDFNKDGKMDVVIGPFWYAGPSFKQATEYYAATNTFKVKGEDGIERTIKGFTGELSGRNGYSNNFLTYTYDFNGDGWMDILVFGWPGKETVWYENPKNVHEVDGKGHWQAHVVWDETDNESPQLGDMTGDGKPELIAHSRGFLGYVELDWKNPTKMGKFRAISHFDKKRFFKYTLGYGYGDLNADGLVDILERDGWWQQPADWDGKSKWKLHKVSFAPEGARGGAQMYVHDMNNDGLNDVVTSHDGHGYGLSVYLQYRDGRILHFLEEPVLGEKASDNPYGVAFSQLHAIALADMNQDGLMDIVTGKRFWAHGPDKDAEPNAPAVLYWFKTVKVKREVSFVPMQIDNNSGVGTQVTVGDLNGDKFPDVVVGNKKGAFVFINKAKRVGWTEYEKATPKAAW